MGLINGVIYAQIKYAPIARSVVAVLSQEALGKTDGFDGDDDILGRPTRLSESAAKDEDLSTVPGLNFKHGDRVFMETIRSHRLGVR